MSSTAAIIAFLAICLFQNIAGTQFGYAPGEAITSDQDMVDHANGKIQKLGNNFKRMAGNAVKDGQNLIQSLQNELKNQSIDGDVQAMVDQAKPVDVSSCVSNARTDAFNACVSNANTTLAPYYQHLQQMVAASQSLLPVAFGNVSDCQKNSAGSDALATCLQAVGAQVFDGRDKLMAAILAEMAQFRSNAPGITNDFRSCVKTAKKNILGQVQQCIDQKEKDAVSQVFNFGKPCLLSCIIQKIFFK
ncbi:uncharacterized protein [Periplaneta americana]|uniref:uncharacterized protein n=1 Tax=Periplaneta americana TaxID=6978 RepID=UPI0037E89B88